MTRQEIIDLIHNEYDPRPDLGRGDYPAFEWDDGSGRIADAVMQHIEALEAALRHIEDTLGYVKNEGKSPAVRESNAHIAWKIARAALAPEQGK
jgi:hypothetical protein